MAHISINMADMPIEMLDFEPVNPLISKCSIKVCYVGDEPNRNRSIITKDVAKEIAKSIPGSPIVGYYNEATGDFEEHNRIIDISNGKFQIKDTTRPYGFVSMDARVWFQWFEDDGMPHEYLCTEGYIWTGQYPESQRVIEKGNNHSMELDTDTIDAYWTKDNNGKPQFFIINEAIMSKLCILGEEVEPCFEGASITKFSFEDSFKEQLFSFMEKMQEILSNEGGTTPVLNNYAVEIGDSLWQAICEYIWSNYRDSELYIYGIYEEDSQKFAILRSRKDLTYYRLNFSLTENEGFTPMGELSQVAPDFKPVGEAQFALEDIDAYMLQFAESKKENDDPEESEPAVAETVVEEPVVDSEPAVELESEPAVETEPAAEPQSNEDDDVKVEYNLDEIPEYQELLNKYSILESKISELETNLQTVTSERDTLAKFKEKIDRKEKEDLIKSFYMLSDDLKKDCLDNIDTYSKDDIEAKLSILCVRNKVSFNLDEDTKKDNPTTFNLDSVENEYDGLPAWVIRVKEKEKEMKNS